MNENPSIAVIVEGCLIFLEKFFVFINRIHVLAEIGINHLSMVVRNQLKTKKKKNKKGKCINNFPVNVEVMCKTHFR